MKHKILQLGVASLMLLGAAVASQGQEVRKGDQPSTRTSEVRERTKLPEGVVLAKILQYQLLLLRAKDKKTCTVDAGPPCVIDMKLLTVDGKEYCLAVAPNLEVKTQSSAGNKKIVAWKLSHSSLGTTPRALEFHTDSGIITTQDADKQIEKGGHGDGGVGIPSKDMYHVKTKRDKLNATSVYLPVILWGPPGKEDLCAAIDPTIVNVP